MRYYLILWFALISTANFGQATNPNFSIRTITAGINLKSISDTTTFVEAIQFLKGTRDEYVSAGYNVQTIRISTQNFYTLVENLTFEEALPHLIKLDRIAQREGVVVAIGWILPPNENDAKISDWVVDLITQTQMISFSLPISSAELGIHHNSIKASAEIIRAISTNSIGGEGNFRFTASANCPPGTPFFPAAYHQGANSFAIGLESPNLLKEVFAKSEWSNAKQNLKMAMERVLRPIENIAMQIAESKNDWVYDGIDTSPAPGLDASIGEAIETLTGQPFGGSSTLSACALITDVLKNLEIKTCGYSGLMLPVIEDKILAKRAMEKRYTVQELLLFSSVSGTGLDVIPLPGNTSIETIERVLNDVASLSLKYTNKALSARLFLIPGKVAGDLVTFDNPYLTDAMVMKIE
jgi:hypothetical protein